MASYFLRGKIYWVIYYENGVKKQHSLKTKDRTIAKYKTNEIEKKLYEGESPIPPKNKPLKDIKDEFLERQKGRVSATQYSNCKCYIDQFIAFKNPGRLTEFNDGAVESFLASKDNCSVHFKRNAIATFKAFLNWCVSRNYLARSPLKLKKPTPKRSPHRFLNLKEIKKLIEAAEPEILFPQIVTALHCGARKGEIKRLEWTDIDFETNRILIRAGKTENFRYVPLSKKLKSVLNKYRKNSGKCFTEWANERRILRRIKRKSKLKDMPRFWYTLRHTFASHYYMNTHDLKGLSEILGHSDIKITAATYVHLLENHTKENINKVGY